jgi:hypothetical protein
MGWKAVWWQKGYLHDLKAPFHRILISNNYQGKNSSFTVENWKKPQPGDQNYHYQWKVDKVGVPECDILGKTQ